MLFGRVSRLLVAAAVAVAGVSYVGFRVSNTDAPASAATPPTLTIPRNAASRGYMPRIITMNRGQTLRVVNNDSQRHTVTSTARSRSGSPLFSVLVYANRTVQVTATSHLAPGRYAFHCNFHVRMTGTLVVRGSGGGTTGAAQTFDQPLYVPYTFRSANLRFRLQKTYVQVFAHGPKTLMWTYAAYSNGRWIASYPGPTIRRPTGRLTKVSFFDTLPYKFSVHLHGDHHSEADDGQPDGPYVLSPGKSRTYTYPLRDAGQNERAGFFYYHDHRLGLTASNNWMGLQGLFIVDDPTREHAIHLPSAPYDVPLMVADRSFTSTNQLRMPFSSSGAMVTAGAAAPPNDATIGNRILVNGRYSPYLNVTTHRYRFRLVNTSTFQSYDFKLTGNHPFWQVGTGDSLLPNAVKRTDILLGPAQRADVVVSFDADRPGGRVNLVSVPRVAPKHGGVPTPSATLMQFRVTRHVADYSRNPARWPRQWYQAPVALRPANYTWTIYNPQRTTMPGMSMTGTAWAFNHQPYNPNNAVTVHLGQTVQWVLQNSSTVTHYVHLHEEQWRTVSRDGHAPPAYELGLQDTWKLDPGEWVRVQGTFTDYTGTFMIHCHMLDHEDHGLMAQFKVVR